MKPQPHLPSDQGEVSNIIKGLNNKSTNGPDDVSAKLLKKYEEKLSPVPANHINASLTRGQLTDTMKRAKVTPILKTGDQANVCNNRRDVYKPQIELFPKGQPNSTSKSIRICTKTLHFVSMRWTNKKYVKKSRDEIFLVCCLFVDLSKAFDMVDHGMFAHEIELMNVSRAESDF
jgi:hypothetical protein